MGLPDAHPALICSSFRSGSGAAARCVRSQRSERSSMSSTQRKKRGFQSQGAGSFLGVRRHQRTSGTAVSCMAWGCPRPVCVHNYWEHLRECVQIERSPLHNFGSYVIKLALETLSLCPQIDCNLETKGQQGKITININYLHIISRNHPRKSVFLMRHAWS